MENNEILIYDCTIFSNVNLINKNYSLLERRNKIPKKIKRKEITNSVYNVPVYKKHRDIITLIYKN